MKTQYDAETAVTFLMLGLGVGAFLTLLLAPRPQRPFLDAAPKP